MNDDIQRVLELAIELSGDANRARAWLDVPMPEYRGMTPRELIAAGRSDVLIAHIQQIQSGSSG